MLLQLAVQQREATGSSQCERQPWIESLGSPEGAAMSSHGSFESARPCAVWGCNSRCSSGYETPTLQNELFRLFLHRKACNRSKSIMKIFQTHIHTFVLALKPGACQPGSENAFLPQIFNPLNAIKGTELAWSMHAGDVLSSFLPSFCHEDPSLCEFSPFCSSPRARA